MSDKKYKVGYVPGSFDLFHIGHLNLIRRSKELCEHLIVGVCSDELIEVYKGRRPYVPLSERMEIVSAIKYVDEVVMVDFSNTNKIDAWKQFHFDCHFSGSDHADHWKKERDFLEAKGVKMIFFDYTEGISTTQILTDTERLPKVQTDREYVVDNFKKNFSMFLNEPIVLYGLGPNTQAVLEELPEFNIVGLMDAVRTGDEVFGKKVITIEQADDLGVKKIVIIARTSNVPIIYRRISKICAEKDISVFDVNGNQQSLMESKDELLKSYADITEEKITAAITQNEVISFDVFDTLLMRDVLFPRDIFLILENKLCSKYGDVFRNFATNRILAEQELYLSTNPTLEEIYRELATKMNIPPVKAMEVMNMELSIEKKHLIAREKMRILLNDLIIKGISVCITSDMYISSEQIRSFLVDNGYMVQSVPIFVSNEYRVSKYNGLFGELRKKYGNKRILHIGDNSEADGSSAKKYGIDEIFLIKSALQMLEDSKASEMLEHNDNLANRMIIARFISRQFNDPFLFSKTGGKLIIRSCYELGYDFIAPITMAFIKWIIKRTEQLDADGILLSSRDGYIVSKILLLLSERGIAVPKSIYFYASRNVCVLSMIKDDEDIKYVASLAFSGDVVSMMKKRFYLTDNDILPRDEGESDEQYILKHKDKIINNASKMRERYHKYLALTGINKKRYTYMDFVSSGTCQYALSHFLKSELYGLYFVRIFDPLKGGIYVDSLCKVQSVYKGSFAICDKYIMLENIFTSPEPTLVDFDQNGMPVLTSEQRNEKQLNNLCEVHEGIIDSVVNMICSSEYECDDITLMDKFIKFIGKDYTEFITDFFEDNILGDEFCNRSFDTNVFVN